MNEVNDLSFESLQDNEFFLLCSSSEIPSIQNYFHLDESTVLECTNLDESVRFASLDGYDFISMVYLQQKNNRIATIEVNAYIFPNGIILVMPDQVDGLLKQVEITIINRFLDLTGQNGQLNKGLYAIFHTFLMDFSNLLEKIEDDMEILQEKIMMNVENVKFADVNHYRQMTYTIRKQMRALSYLGSQILINENKLINSNHMRHFHNIDLRLKKQYDFSVNLCELSNQLQVSYDSRMAAKTMDAVNKLTVITIFFGPLTVITGIYGMNFLNMPEIKWEWGYPLSLLIMAITTGITYLILKKKKWL
jgi:magnesium transporter